MQLYDNLLNWYTFNTSTLCYCNASIVQVLCKCITATSSYKYMSYQLIIKRTCYICSNTTLFINLLQLPSMICVSNKSFERWVKTLHGLPFMIIIQTISVYNVNNKWRPQATQGLFTTVTSNPRVKLINRLTVFYDVV